MQLDFRTKLVVTLVISYILLQGNLYNQYFPIIIFLSALPYFLLLLEKKYKEVFKGLSVLLVAVLLEIFLLHRNQSSILDSIVLFITMVTIRMAPGLIMGRYSLLTTTMSDLVASLKKLYFSDLFIIPISIMFRFFYTVKEDYHHVKEAMYLQGLTGKQFFHTPLRIIEYRYVPLLMCLSRTADDVSISAMTRGMRIGRKRSTISQTKLHIQDYVLLILMLFILILDIWSRYA
ncbi:MAG: energy-coupling factor transporter transmembrane component T [Streptococcus sp.]|nr:energy-coupling factor transporter transmembrane component T [Streptococcus sp.]